MASNRNYGPSGAPGAPSTAINTNGAAAPVLPATQGFNLTTEQVILNPALSGAGNPVPLVVPIPSDSALEQQPFEISASGYIDVGAAGNLTLNLYSGTSATPANNILLKSSGAQAIAAASLFPYLIRARAIYDSVSGKLHGAVSFIINGALVAETAFTNPVTGVKNSNNPVASFLLSAQFSVANAANIVVVKDFAINF